MTLMNVSVTSLMKRLNKHGPNTLPCGIPLMTRRGEEREDPTRTDWDLLVRNDWLPCGIPLMTRRGEEREDPTRTDWDLLVRNDWIQKRRLPLMP